MTDLISRKATIGACGDWYVEEGTEEGFIGTVKQLLERLPSAREWIPVSERLPEDLEEVNITWINTNPPSYYNFIKGKPFTGSAVYYKGKWFWYSALCTDYLTEYGFSPDDNMDDAIKVIAWMPLPAPFKGGEEE